MQITFNIPFENSQDWSLEQKEQWVRKNILNPAMVSHSNSALNESCSIKSKEYHSVAKSILLIQVS